jgi:hypothetical protein
VGQSSISFSGHGNALDTKPTLPLAFIQVFTEEHILDFWNVKIFLWAGYNAGTTTSDKKDMVLGPIQAWLVQIGIANLVSILQLERV